MKDSLQCSKVKHSVFH